MDPTPKEVLQSISDETFQTETGEKGKIQLGPSLSKREIEAFEEILSAPLPEEIKDLLAYCGSLTLLGIERITFAKKAPGYHSDGLFPCGVHLCPDGFGNDFFVDVNTKTGEWGPVFYGCHDAPAFVLVESNLAKFLMSYFDCFRRCAQGGDHMIDFANNIAADLYYKKPGLLSVSEAISSHDPSLSAFARTLQPDAHIADLRPRMPGSGFGWTLKTQLTRYGHDLVFGHWTPPRKGFLGRLFPRK